MSDVREEVENLKVLLRLVASRMDVLKVDGVEVNFGFNLIEGKYQVTGFRAIKRIDLPETQPVGKYEDQPVALAT